MANEYQILLKTVLGQTIAVLDDFLTLDLTRTVNNVGMLKLSVPFEKYPASFWAPDNIIEVWRSVNGGPEYLEGGTIWWVRKSRKTLSGQGIWGREIVARDAVDLLRRRVVAYPARAAQAKDNKAADDICKAIMRENFGTLATDAARDLSSYLSIAPDLTQCPVIEKHFEHRNILTILQELAQASLKEGTYLAFDIVSTVPASGVALDFRTYAGQRGVDRRWGVAADPVVLDPEAGTLTDVERAEDYQEMVNYAYAGGGGKRGDRKIATAVDAESVSLSPFHRIESWVDAGDTNASGEIQAEADKELKDNRAKKTFSARAVDTEYVQYGRTYGFGDFVTAGLDGELINVRVDGVNLTLKAGKEDVKILLKSDE